MEKVIQLAKVFSDQMPPSAGQKCPTVQITVAKNGSYEKNKYKLLNWVGEFHHKWIMVCENSKLKIVGR